jgi:adenine-specific DNA-methyltransferase
MGCKFGSNFQPFVRKKTVLHEKDEDITREPETVRAYRDTWELGTHSYLSYIRDRLLLAKEMLGSSGSIFVQISDENVHHLRKLLEEVFGADNYINTIQFMKTAGLASDFLANVNDYLLWFAKDRGKCKFNRVYFDKSVGGESASQYTWVELKNGSCRAMSSDELNGAAQVPDGSKIFSHQSAYTAGSATTTNFDFEWSGRIYRLPSGQRWRTTIEGMTNLGNAGRFLVLGNSLRYKRYLNDFPAIPFTEVWRDTSVSGFSEQRTYVVQTNTKVIERCMLMTSSPGDLVVDITCGSGTTATVAEKWGRRWITCDTSRVPLALARQRLLTATYPWYSLKTPAQGPAGGFIYERRQNRKGEEVGGLVPRITLKSIAHEEEPEMITLVDRPEVNKQITRVCGTFTVEATIQAALTLDDEDGNEGAGVAKVIGSPRAYLDRMIEVLRQSKTLRLPGNVSVELETVRPLADRESLHAEATAKNGSEKRIAIVFGPEDGAIGSEYVFNASH